MKYRMDNGMMVIGGSDFERGLEVVRKQDNEFLRIDYGKQRIIVDKKVSADVWNEMCSDIMPEGEKWFDCLPEMPVSNDFSRRYAER